VSVGCQNVFSYTDIIVDIWSSNILGNDTARVDPSRSSTYQVAEVHHSHCYIDLSLPLPMEVF